ncbi:hypothetical protein LPJ53_003597 [Coemansia erecta]|uniref:WD40 repeat-like protein n=1 Tax=Coemansia erecta TaxID=147472 RepID=A0A9W7XVY2_9FUNG|nr:hypothetical protein LPJ53_003597 [Coemansia erecta]
MNSLLAQPTARKITAISWLPPAAGTAYTDAAPRFLAGTGGKTKELVLWSTPNPDFSTGTPALADFVSKTTHASGGVQAIAPVTAELVLTASSLGFLAAYRVANDEVVLGGQARAHGDEAAPEVCTGVAVQPGGGSGRSVASCGEDGRLVLCPVDRLDAQQRVAADAGSLTSLCWPTSSQLAVATRAGQAKLFDPRALKSPSSVFYNPASHASLECISAHPSQPFLLATGSDDGCVVLWDVRNPQRPRNELFGVHAANVWQVGFDPADARRVVSCSEDGSLAVTRWDGEGGGGVHETRRLASRLNVLSVNCFDICPYTREHMLVAGSDSGNLLMAKTGAQW